MKRQQRRLGVKGFVERRLATSKNEKGMTTTRLLRARVTTMRLCAFSSADA